MATAEKRNLIRPVKKRKRKNSDLFALLRCREAVLFDVLV